MSFGEDINKLISRGDGEQLEIAFLKILVNDVAIDLNVLGVFMEDIIMSNVDSITIVTIKRNGSGLWSIHVRQEPDKLAGGASKGTVLNLSIGTGNNILLHATPRDKRST